jgi:ABC-type transporter Mla maintaining outer membrane lipid asymmetry ATPase subunit MlaF
MSIETIADRVTMLADGRVVAQGRLADVRTLDEPVVRAFFDRLGGVAYGDRASLLARLSTEERSCT